MKEYQEYPKAFYNKDGKSVVVKSVEEFAQLDAKEWRDSPAAFESHADHAKHKERLSHHPDPIALAAERAELDRERAALDAERKAFEAETGRPAQTIKVNK